MLPYTNASHGNDFRRLVAFNFAQRQSYAYAIGLYTRPEIKADRMLNFVLMRSAFCRGVETTNFGVKIRQLSLLSIFRLKCE